jgi:serine/threonine protein kinase
MTLFSDRREYKKLLNVAKLPHTWRLMGNMPCNVYYCIDVADKSLKGEWQIQYQMIRGICRGLNSLHGQRINHLDLKPDNILLDAGMNPKITDFGISRCFDEGISRVYTQIICGTP